MNRFEAGIYWFLLVGLGIGMLVSGGKRVFHSYLFVFGFMLLALQIPYVQPHPVPVPMPELRPYALGFATGLLLGFVSGRLAVRIQSKKIQGNRITRKKVRWTTRALFWLLIFLNPVFWFLVVPTVFPSFCDSYYCSSMENGFIAGWIVGTGITVSVWALLWERQRQQMLFFE